MNYFPKEVTVKKLEDLEESMQRVKTRFEEIDFPSSMCVDRYLQSCFKAQMSGAIENIQDIIEQIKDME